MAAFDTPPCPACGVWKCRNCQTRTRGRSRFYPWKHHCKKCRSRNGRMLPIHHRPDIYENHASSIDPDMTCYYPLEAPAGMTATPSAAAQPRKNP